MSEVVSFVAGMVVAVLVWKFVVWPAIRMLLRWWRDRRPVVEPPGLVWPEGVAVRRASGEVVPASLRYVGQRGRCGCGAPIQVFEVVEPADPHLCCGSAGTYNLLQPEISGELKRRKVATLEARRPDVIAAGNIGCMMQIGSGTKIPVVHTAERIDWATGGPRPRALG